MSSNHQGHDHHAMMVADFKKRFWLSLLLTVPILALSPFIQKLLGLETVLAFTGSRYVLAGVSSVVFIYGGWPFLTGLYSELKSRQPGMMTLIGLAISVAYFYSLAVVLGLKGEVFFWELATLVDVMLLGHWIEMRSVMGASRALEELAKLMPATAHRLEASGKQLDVPVEELKVGHKVVVKPGEKIPMDGEVVDGKSSVNEAMLTGESKPVNKKAGNQVVGGSINGAGSLTVQVSKTGADTYLSQVIDMVKSAQASKSKTQNLANRAAFWLTLVAIIVGGGTFVTWLLIGQDANFALGRMVTVMVITCPHALGLAIPLVVSISTAKTASQGLLIKNRNGFENARLVDVVIFDKTGTLTEGKFKVRQVIPLAKITGEEVINVAAAVESKSEHPLSKPIVDDAKRRYAVQNFKSLPGKGVSGLVNGKKVQVVGPNYLREKKLQVDLSKISQAPAGSSLVYVLVDGEVAGIIALADRVRSQAKSAVKKLAEKKIDVMILTGDSKEVAAAVAKQLGVVDYFAEVLPQNKQAKVRQVQKEGKRVAMVGDGVNDAPALAAADVGIAIGAGTDVAAETADVVLVRNDPRDVMKVIDYAARTYGKMKQNLIYATGYNIFAVPLAAGVLYQVGIVLSPAVGAALMSLSTVAVAINARLLRLEPS